jgi:hypothetical protein
VVGVAGMMMLLQATWTRVLIVSITVELDVGVDVAGMRVGVGSLPK